MLLFIYYFGVKWMAVVDFISRKRCKIDENTVKSRKSSFTFSTAVRVFVGHVKRGPCIWHPCSKESYPLYWEPLFN